MKEDPRKYLIPIDEDRDQYQDVRSHLVPIEDEEPIKKHPRFIGDMFDLPSIHEIGERGKEFLGGLLESKPLEAIRYAGAKGQEGLLKLGELLSGKDLSQYANPGGEPLSKEERRSPQAYAGRSLGDVVPSLALPFSVESILPEALQGATREATALGLSGALQGVAEHPKDAVRESQLGALENLATFGGAKLLGKGLNISKDLYRSYLKQTPQKIEAFLRGAFEEPHSPASLIIKEAYGSPVAESSTLQNIIGNTYQNHAVRAGKHIFDEGIVRPLSRGIGFEEKNPVYNSLERRLKEFDEIPENMRIRLNKEPYEEAIKKATKNLSQTTRQAIPKEFISDEDIVESPHEAFKRYRQLNRRIMNRPHSDPDLVRAASQLKTGIVNQLEDASSKSPEIKDWLQDFKKANKAFAISSKYEKRYKDIQDTRGGIAPKDLVNRILKMVDQNPESLRTVMKDFGDVRNPIKSSLLESKLGQSALDYHPINALKSFSSLSPEVRKVLFDEPERKLLEKLSMAKGKIGTLMAPQRHAFGTHAAHALGLGAEAMGIPFAKGASIPWLGRILEEGAQRRAYSKGQAALLDRIEDILKESETVPKRKIADEKSAKYSLPFISSALYRSLGEEER